jgi:hypothetical protein
VLVVRRKKHGGAGHQQVEVAQDCVSQLGTAGADQGQEGGLDALVNLWLVEEVSDGV